MMSMMRMMSMIMSKSDMSAGQLEPADPHVLPTGDAGV